MTKQNVSKVISYFQNLILDELYAKELDCWVAGGSIRDMFTVGHVTKDVDLFFKKQSDIKKATDYILNNLEGEIDYESDNVISIKSKTKNIMFDIVKRPHANPKACLDDFDFTVCSGAVYKNEFEHDPQFFKDLEEKVLVIKNINNPYSCLRRLQDYVKKGFTMDKPNLVKLYEKIIVEGDLDDCDGDYY